MTLPGWQYPVVCDLATGQVQYDNFAGHWGDLKQLHRFLQAYAVENRARRARKRGQSVTEQVLQDGSIKLLDSVVRRCRMGQTIEAGNPARRTIDDRDQRHAR